MLAILVVVDNWGWIELMRVESWDDESGVNTIMIVIEVVIFVLRELI